MHWPYFIAWVEKHIHLQAWWLYGDSQLTLSSQVCLQDLIEQYVGSSFLPGTPTHPQHKYGSVQDK